MLDDDLYKLTSAAVIFHNFPNAHVRYQFINRGGTPFPPFFAEELHRQVRLMEFLKLNEKEYDWMKEKMRFLPATFLEWFKSYRLDSRELTITQTDGQLEITINGPWYRTIFWEVKLMAVISELYFRLTKHNKASDWEKRIIKKNKYLLETNWMDFGTRRRYSFEVQDRVVDVMSNSLGFLGTSNPYLAYKYNTNVQGTYPHEVIMGVSAHVGILEANPHWMDLWRDYYGIELSVALTDTFTTPMFLNSLDTFDLNRYKGFRQDSGDPHEWVKIMLADFKKKNINPLNKTFIFSDGLNEVKYRKLYQKYNKVIGTVVGGIGTYLTNDVDAKPLNMVIKMTHADFHFPTGMVPVVKLSDDKGKHTGNPAQIKKALETVRMALTK